MYQGHRKSQHGGASFLAATSSVTPTLVRLRSSRPILSRYVMATPDLPHSAPAVSGSSLQLPLLALNPNRFKAPSSKRLSQARTPVPQISKEQRLQQQFEFLRTNKSISEPRERQFPRNNYQGNQPGPPLAVSHQQQSVTVSRIAHQQPAPVPVWYQVPGTRALSHNPLYLRPSDVPHILSQLDDSTTATLPNPHHELKVAETPKVQQIPPSLPTSGPNIPSQKQQCSLHNDDAKALHRPWSPNTFVPPRPPVFPDLRRKLEREKQEAVVADRAQQREAKNNNAKIAGPGKEGASSKRKASATFDRPNTRASKRLAMANLTGPLKPKGPSRNSDGQTGETGEVAMLPGSSSHVNKNTAASNGVLNQKTADLGCIDENEKSAMAVDMEEYFRSAKHAFCPETVKRVTTNLFGMYICSQNDNWDQVERLMDGV